MPYQLLLAGIKRGALPPVLDEEGEEVERKICDCGADWCIDVTGLNSPLGLSQPFCLTSNNAGDRDPRLEQVPLALFAPDRTFYQYRPYLDTVSQQVLRWLKNDRHNNSIWLYERRDGEPGWRRSWVQQLWFNDQCLLSTAGQAVSLPTQITRTWWYEDVNYLDPQLSPLARNPNIMNWSVPALGGTEYGRIAVTELTKSVPWILSEEFDAGTIISGRRMSQIWLGIKEDIGCGLSEWQSDWTLENATAIQTFDLNPPYNAIDLAQVVDDDEGDSCWEGDFDDEESLTPRIEICLEDAVESMPGAFTNDVWQQWRGRYLVLALAQVDLPADFSDTIVSFSAEFGWKCDDAFRQTNRIATIQHQQLQPPFQYQATNQGAHWIELGEVSLAPDSGRALDDRYCDELRQATIRLSVGLEQGSSDVTWRICRLRFIPIEHLMRVDLQGCLIDELSAGLGSVRIIRHEDEHMSARLYRVADSQTSFDGYLSTSNLSVDEHDYYLPYDKPSTLVIAANTNPDWITLTLPITQIGAALNYADPDFDLTPDMLVYRRWLSVRSD